jgi:tetratricopeptide (TPR) repeat protein
MFLNLDGNGESTNESLKFIFLMRFLAIFGCLIILLYSWHFKAFGQFYSVFGLGILVAGAALLSGFLLGFIFAIPRVGDKKGIDTTQPEGAQTRNSGTEQNSVPFNANLVEISDWLTKIIVGVGLVELKSIPDMLGKLSYYIALGLRPAPDAGGASGAESLFTGQAIALAILTFYFALGFLMGYVWTMIFFQHDLQAQNKQLEQQNKTEQLRTKIANRIWQAEVSVNANQLDEAMTSIDEALKIDPKNGLAVLTKARILKRQALKSKSLDKNKMKQAIACADLAIALLPNYGEPYYNKACYEARLDPKGMKSDLIANLKSAFLLNPGLRQMSKSDDDLVALKHDADFIKLTHLNQQPRA